MDAPGFSRQSPAHLPIVAVASGKGGVGKSSVAVAIGRELVRSGRKAGLVDAPPGITFPQQGVLSGAGRVATILVVTPAEVSHLDTGRALSTLRQVRTPVLGGVENMAYFECRCCGEKTELHAPGPAERTIWASGVERLARLPFRPDAVISTADLAAVLEAVETHIAA